MPNWVINHVECDNTQALADLRDFNRIVPMPLTLEESSAGTHSRHYKKMRKQQLSYAEMLQWPSGEYTLEEWQQILRRFYICEHLYGFIDADSWSEEHWGTKWNANNYMMRNDLRHCTFASAWSHPQPVLEALSKRYPQTVFEVAYADEDMGHNVGIYILCNGIYLYLQADNIKQGSQEAHEIAFSLWRYAKKCRFSDLTGTYEYIGDDFVENQETV